MVDQGFVRDLHYFGIGGRVVRRHQQSRLDEPADQRCGLGAEVGRRRAAPRVLLAFARADQAQEDALHALRGGRVMAR